MLRFLLGVGAGYWLGRLLTEFQHAKVFVMKRETLQGGLNQDSFLSVNGTWTDAAHALPIAVIKAEMMLPQFRAIAPPNTQYSILTKQDILQNALANGNP